MKFTIKTKIALKLHRFGRVCPFFAKSLRRRVLTFTKFTHHLRKIKLQKSSNLSLLTNSKSKIYLNSSINDGTLAKCLFMPFLQTKTNFFNKQHVKRWPTNPNYQCKYV